MKSKHLLESKLSAVILRKTFVSFIFAIVVFITTCVATYLGYNYFQDEQYERNRAYLEGIADKVKDKLENDYKDASDTAIIMYLKSFKNVQVYIIGYESYRFVMGEDFKLTHVLDESYAVYSDPFFFRERYVNIAVFTKQQGPYIVTVSAIIFFFISSFLLFLYVFIKLMRKEINYIVMIQQSVKKIEEGNLQYKCPVEGSTELAQLAVSVNKMGDTLYHNMETERELELSKQELITNVSHDLRTPLTSIIGYLGLINKVSDETKREKYLKICQDKARTLKGLIDDLFEFNKLTNNQIKFDYSELDMGYYIEQIINEYVPLLEEQGFKVTWNNELKGEKVLLDPEKTIRVFDNLFGNIMKYAEQNSTVIILAKCLEEHIEITLANIPKRGMDINVARMFEKTITSDESRSQGSGLGLAIAKEILERQNGAINATMQNGNLVIKINLRKRY